jgi:hypothetical protein
MSKRNGSLYPIIVRRMPGQIPVAQLGRDVDIALVNPHGPEPRIFHRSDIEAFGLEPFHAYARARTNLATLFRSGAIRGKYVSGPAGSRIIVLRHSLAPSCIVMPNLWAWARKELGHDELCGAIPRRDALVMFSDEGREHREEIQASLGGAFVREMLTTEIFAIDESGVHRYRDSEGAVRLFTDPTIVMDGPTLDRALQLTRDLELA